MITKKQLQQVINNSATEIPLTDEQSNIIGTVTNLEIKENKVIGKVLLRQYQI